MRTTFGCQKKSLWPEDETTVEVDVGSSGSRASLPAEKPADVPVEREDVSEQRENPKAVAIPRERDEMPVAEHQRPIRNRKQVWSVWFRRAN